MSRILESIMLEHDLRLLLLAVAICTFGVISTVNVSGRASSSHRRMLWLVLLSVCAGATVWATHFIAMLAYRQEMSTTYDPALTALSFGAGVVIMGCGFALAIRSGSVRKTRLLGGAIVGIGVVVLHYIGMAALRTPGSLTWTPALVATSIVLSVSFGALALAVTFEPARAHARGIGAFLMLLMIVSLHFTAMGAVHVHGMAGVSANGGVTRSTLATAVAVASFSILLISMTGALIDQGVSRRLAGEAQRFRTLAEGAFEGVVVHRAGDIIDANAAARQMLGIDDATAGEPITRAFRVLLDAAQPAAAAEPIEVVLERADGSVFSAEICRRRMLLSDGSEGELCAIRDLTFRKESEARIAHLALHDSLTDLPNRRFFMELANKSIAQAKRTGERFALFALDLDNFKLVNDTHGHAAGDEVIRMAAQRIAASVRGGDIAARFGGDEFAILQTGSVHLKSTMTVAERLLDVLQEPVILEYGEVAITVSIGIAFYPDDGTTVEELLRSADTAMYRAKADGKAMSCFFERHMDAALVARRRLELGLRRAVAQERLSVVYQPIVDSHTRQPLGFEALVRWPDAELGMIMPSEFIPVAEETGLIVAIGDFVIREACREAMSWPGDLRVAVNLSAVQFRRKGLIESVRGALAETGLPGNRLELEVTETLLMENRQEALRLLNELRQLDVRISMDDFGTGYSALSYLQSFPFDKIKIDRIFVTDLASNPQNASIVRAVVAMGRSLDMRVVAEGVETNQAAHILEELLCDEIQGYLVAPPMPPDDIADFLAASGIAPTIALHTA